MSFLYGLAGLGDRGGFGDGLFNGNGRYRRGCSGGGLRGDSGGLKDGGRGCCRLNCGGRGGGRPGYGRLDWSWLFRDAGLFFAGGGGSGLR